MNQPPEKPTTAFTRQYPAKGVRIVSGQPTIVFVTVCTANRKPWLATPVNHAALVRIWRNEATAWLVGRYVLMPDHVHLFAALGCTEDTARDDNMHQPVHVDMHPPLTLWVRFWKRRFAQDRGLTRRSWRGGMWDTRMRTARQYEEKWAYVRENPVRYGLVARPEDWPYAGHIHDLVW